MKPAVLVYLCNLSLCVLRSKTALSCGVMEGGGGLPNNAPILSEI